MLARSLLRRGCSLRGRRCASRKALDAEARAATVALLGQRGWTDDLPARDSVTKRFEFATFNDAFGWMARVAMFAEASDHHPEWANTYATVDVTLATHSARGVTGKDAALADFMDYAHAGRRGAGPR
jgi:4a-hydroxytetrahydrobiopterin dehydratase